MDLLAVRDGAAAFAALRQHAVPLLHWGDAGVNLIFAPVHVVPMRGAARYGGVARP